MKNFIFKLLLLLGAPLVTLFAIELGLRKIQSGKFHLVESCPHYLKEPGQVALKPGFKGWWHGAYYEINRNGFRMPEEVRETTNQLRVLALGDSVTEAYCVPDVRNGWPLQLERVLQESTAAYVINAGVAGWNLLVADATNGITSGQFLRFMKDEAALYRPNVIIYCICINDIPGRANNLFEIDNTKNRARFRLFPESWRNFLKQRAFYRTARDWYREQKFFSLDFSSIPTPDLDPAFWRQVAGEIAAIKQEADRIGSDFACVIWPYSYQVLPANQDLLQINQRITGILAEHGIPYRDLTTSLNETNVLQHYVLGDYIHPNARGHQLIAAAAADLIHEFQTAGKVKP